MQGTNGHGINASLLARYRVAFQLSERRQNNEHKKAIQACSYSAKSMAPELKARTEQSDETGW